MLAFVHIPKTAGTTLHKVISHQYAKSQIFIHHDAEGPPSAELAARIEAQGSEVIIGHFSVGLHKFIPSLRYISCMRDPVARLISHYHHALHDPSHYLHSDAKSRTLLGYVSSGLSGELTNGMTRLLAGLSDFHGKQVDESVFALAASNLETLFDTIIPCNRFDEGLLLLSRDLNWKKPFYLRRKVGRYAYDANPPDESTLRAIEEQNHYDRRLYDLCIARFDQRASSDLNLANQLAVFRKTNATYGKATFLAREFKSRYF